jgi:DNA-binding MarR family transcriptional regulator
LKALSAPDEIVHQSMRLKIMSTLNTLPRGEWMEFTRLKGLLKATDGNLGAHLTTLENAKYIEALKDFAGKKPRTRVRQTAAGRAAFERHVAYLRAILDGGDGT